MNRSIDSEYDIVLIMNRMHNPSSAPRRAHWSTFKLPLSAALEHVVLLSHGHGGYCAYDFDHAVILYNKIKAPHGVLIVEIRQHYHGILQHCVYWPVFLVLHPRPLQHNVIDVPSLRSPHTRFAVPRAWGILRPRPLQHLQMADALLLLLSCTSHGHGGSCA